MMRGTTRQNSATYRRLAGACVLHALVVVALWVGMFWGDLQFVPARAWVVLGWAWWAWPVVLVSRRERAWVRTGLPIAAGFAALWPCLPTLFMFTVWSTRGFAP